MAVKLNVDTMARQTTEESKQTLEKQYSKEIKRENKKNPNRDMVST